MARALTSAQRALLRSPDLHINALATFHLDAGTFRFCDDITGFDLIYAPLGYTFLGANAFSEAAEIRSGKELSAEPVTLLLDGNRMAQAGVADPARVLQDIMGYLFRQRRVDYALGFRYSYENVINLIVPAYAGKINSVRLLDRSMNFGDDAPRTNSYLEIVLDSLAMRYNRATHRIRSHQDQLEIDPTDQFYSHTVDILVNEQNLFWGKKAPNGTTGGVVFPGSGGGTGGILDSWVQVNN